MRTGHQLRCLVALITSLQPTGWFLLWGSYCAREVMDGFNEREWPLRELPHPGRGEQGDLRLQDSVNLTVENILLLPHRESDMACCQKDKTVWF